MAKLNKTERQERYFAFKDRAHGRFRELLNAFKSLSEETGRFKVVETCEGGHPCITTSVVSSYEENANVEVFVNPFNREKAVVSITGRDRAVKLPLRVFLRSPKAESFDSRDKNNCSYVVAFSAYEYSHISDDPRDYQVVARCNNISSTLEAFMNAAMTQGRDTNILPEPT